MYAHVFATRIDIYGGNSFSAEQWESLLNDLEAKHVPNLMQEGTRASTGVDSEGRMITTVMRTSNMTDSEIVVILTKYEISVASPASA